MNLQKRKPWFSKLIIMVTLMCLTLSATALTLSQAEKIALNQAPELKQLHAKEQSLLQSAIAARQLTDPKLILGGMNLPVDTFSLNQEPMTQLQIGVMQAFPKGHSLKYRSLEKRADAKVEFDQSKVMRLQILRSVRMGWLDLYYWQKVKKILHQQKRVFQHLLHVTTSLLANNKAQQKDVVRAQLEISNIDEQLIEARQHIITARIELARWIGMPFAKKAITTQLPHWQHPSRLQRLKKRLKVHPILRSDDARIAANSAGVNLAKQQFYPGFSAGIVYGFRQGRNFDGSSRPDFLSAQVKIDLPIFTYNRQDRELNASEESLIAAQEAQQVSQRELIEMLNTAYTNWQELSKSVRLYQQRLLPEAKHYAEATLVAYQNNQTDFPTLARAYVKELNIKIASLKERVNLDKEQANLLYLEGK